MTWSQKPRSVKCGVASTSPIVLAGAIRSLRRSASSNSSCLVLVRQKAARIPLTRSSSETGTSPRWMSTPRFTQSMSRVASSQPPSSQIHRKSRAVNGPAESPKTKVIDTVPSLHGQTIWTS